MSDFHLTISVREGSDDGPPIPNALILHTGSAITGPDGLGTIEDITISVAAPGFKPYERQTFHRPSLDAPVTVSLQRLSAVPKANP